MDSRVAYTGLVALIAILRLAELAVSRRHISLLKARGAVEVGASHYPWMVALHASFLLACPLEVWLLERPWLPALGYPMLLVLAAATALRVSAIVALGERWTTRVVLVPGDELVARGPYRWLRHPNYLGVALEMLALPLVHTAWMTAVIASAANGLVLRRRIEVEEEALSRWCVAPGRVCR
jgi:methyltransferase